MGMYHSTSGKRGFDPFYKRTNYVIPKETLKKILIREDELRASPEMQERYSAYDSLNWIKTVTEQIQEMALHEFGFSDPEGGVVLNNARFVYKDDPEMNQLTIYMREDKSRRGDLLVGDMYPNANLKRLDGSPISLHDYISSIRGALPSSRPLVLLAGSVT